MKIFRKHVFVCVSGKTCPTQGSIDVCNALRKEVFASGLNGQIRINKSGCLGQCGSGTMVVVYPEGTWYAHVDPSDCKEIVQSHLIGDTPIERLLYDNEQVG